MTVNALLVGGPTVVLRYGPLTFLTDPTFDPPGRIGNLVKTAGPAVSASEISNVHAVLLSHDEHEDNLDESGRAFLKAVDHVFSTPGAAGRVRGVTGLAPWQTFTLDHGDTSTTVTAVPGQHGPKVLRSLLGDVTGFIVQSDGLPTVYVSGDNSSVKVARTVAARFPDIAIAFLFVGGAGVKPISSVRLTLDAARALKVAEAMPGASIVPVHFEDWAHFREQREEFLAAFAAAGATDRLMLLERGVERQLG
ncbi:MAG: Zn-dependent hydrolase [Actinobacteria bacterium HGW-Actinobacteria-4]|nr:MAG: Zn-dependent hydrolase [Actinobacteria bacterium HGW-Actinobacteria-4]